jgi:ferredoxin-NADP reductase
VTATAQTRPLRPPRLGARLRHLAEALATPLLPEDYLDLVDPLRSSTDLRARIEAVRPETRDAATLVLRPGRLWRGHLPGQYVRLGVDIDGVRHWRAYSLTSGPGTGGLIAVTVKAIPGGLVSNHLVRTAQAGTIVQLDQAAGDFTLPEAVPERLLFVTAGSGITPVMGMLRHRLGDGVRRDVVLVHSAPTPDDVIFAGELRAHPGLRLIELHTDRDGMLDERRLADLVPDWHRRETWACGPVGLLDRLETLYAGQAGEGRLHTERFRPTVAVTGQGGTVRFGSTATVAVEGGQTLLDAGEAAGVLMPSGCRMGICFGCVLPLQDGAVRNLRTGDLTEAGPGVLVQTCVSGAAGDCSIGA